MPPFRSRRGRNAASRWLPLIVFLACSALAADPSATPEKKGKQHTSLTNIPLPIGQEAKGLVLPDIDPEGHLRSRFEAGTAKRVDSEHLELRDMKLTTFTPQNTRDLFIEMPVGVLNLKTQQIASQARTTVTRSDFTISGDSMEFNTVDRGAKLVGNVKMVVTGPAKPEPPAAQ
ncbi:MAG: LPS export ABC transporter periplasmic protein LptC [Verrucomicrobiota bacterium]|nr:LPS export ABC transporter periplasmic protein LptC [Verrucomicrobiota bacterium]